MAIPRTIGKYQVARRLGGGGMAEVYAAELTGPEGFRRQVALKRVLPSFAHDPAFAAMFTQEAKLSARFRHPNLVSVLDFDRDPEHGLYLTMELVEGRDLAALLRTGALPVPVAIYVVVEVLRGLGYAHSLPLDPGVVGRGVVHRDVSPQNVLLSWQGEVKVSDFGIAKARIEAMASASVSLKGKPAYMSPEQATRQPLDGRSDLFSVGVVLWELLLGRPLFHGATLHESFAALFHLPIPSPSTERAEVPPDVAAVALKLLSRLPADRYATAEEAIAALLACEAAPRDGRSELVAVLRERLGGAAVPALPERDGAITRLDRGGSESRRRASMSTLPEAGTSSVVLVIEAESASDGAGVAPPLASPGASPGSSRPATSLIVRSPRLARIAAGALVGVLAMMAGAELLEQQRGHVAPGAMPSARSVTPQRTTPVTPARPAALPIDPPAVLETGEDSPALAPEGGAAPLVARGRQGKDEVSRRSRRRMAPARAASRGATANPVVLEQAHNALASP